MQPGNLYCVRSERGFIGLFVVNEQKCLDANGQLKWAIGVDAEKVLARFARNKKFTMSLIGEVQAQHKDIK